jgi:hypothetical protein
MRNIVVSGHCQTNGVAAALAGLMPGDKVTALPLPSTHGTPEDVFIPAAHAADIWIHGADRAFLDKHGLSPGTRGVPAQLGLPIIYFDAFHPDTCMLMQLGSGEIFTDQPLNSAITAWAWQHGLLPDEVPALFHKNVFAALGYFERWAASVEYLRRTFATAGWADEFDRFFLNIQRTGNFMHTFNHPKVHVLASLAKMLAVRLGCSEAVWASDINLQDILAEVAWPLYPDVADAYGLAGGSYQWRWYDTYQTSVQAFAETSYMAYARCNLDKKDIGIGGVDGSVLDRVLGPLCGAAA